MTTHIRSRHRRRENAWRRPHWLQRLPREFRIILREVYEALDSGARALPAMGIRTVLDQFATHRVGDLGSFPRKLDALEAARIIGAVERERLSAVIEAGSAAAHRGHLPKQSDLHHMMACVEHLLWGQFACRASTRMLKKATPRRRRRQPHRSASP